MVETTREQVTRPLYASGGHSGQLYDLHGWVLLRKLLERPSSGFSNFDEWLRAHSGCYQCLHLKGNTVATV